MSFNTLIDWNTCSTEQQRELLMRPAISASDSITRTVSDILDNVKSRGDAALREYSAKFDKTTVSALKVSAEEISAASSRLSDDLKQAMAIAVKNIETFHNAQKLPAVDIETQPGVRCQQVTRPVSSVGLYIPGLSAALLYGINARHTCPYCRLPTRGVVLATAYRRRNFVCSAAVRCAGSV